MSLDARLRHPSNSREQQTMTIYGYARVSRGRDDGTGTLQNQWLRLTGAGVDASHIHQHIITGTVIQRPGLNGLLNAIQPGDVLVVTALDRLGRDTLVRGLPAESPAQLKRDCPGVSPPCRAACALSATIEQNNVRERRKRVGHNWIDASLWSN